MEESCYDKRVKNFGSLSTVFMGDTVSTMDLERTLSHVSTGDSKESDGRQAQRHEGAVIHEQ